jgi:hypothetical protein
MSSKLYDAGAFGILGDRSIDFEGDTIKVMAIANDVPYAFDPTETDLSVLAASELDCSGYVPGFAGSGRKTLGGKAIALDDVNHRTGFDATDPSAWTLASGKTVTAFVVYKHDTNDATSIPIAYIDISDTVTNGNAGTLVFAATGAFFIQH